MLWDKDALAKYVIRELTSYINKHFIRQLPSWINHLLDGELDKYKYLC